MTPLLLKNGQATMENTIGYGGVPWVVILGDEAPLAGRGARGCKILPSLAPTRCYYRQNEEHARNQKKNKAMPNFTLSLGRIRPANTRKSTGDAAGCEADCLILISQHTSRQPTDENLRQQVGLYFFFFSS